MQRSASLSRFQSTNSPWERPRAALDHLGRRLADPVTRPALLWRAFWAPFWIRSDSPKPALPARMSPVPNQDRAGARSPVPSHLGSPHRETSDLPGRRSSPASTACAFAFGSPWPRPVCRGIWLALAFAAVLMLLDVLGGPTSIRDLPP